MGGAAPAAHLDTKAPLPLARHAAQPRTRRTPPAARQHEEAAGAARGVGVGRGLAALTATALALNASAAPLAAVAFRGEQCRAGHVRLRVARLGLAALAVWWGEGSLVTL